MLGAVLCRYQNVVAKKIAKMWRETAKFTAVLLQKFFGVC
jgi:hypothetical protein